jgi:hypothetical protein
LEREVIRVEAQQATSANDLVKPAIEIRGRKRALFGNGSGLGHPVAALCPALAGQPLQPRRFKRPVSKVGACSMAEDFGGRRLAECQTEYLIRRVVADHNGARRCQDDGSVRNWGSAGSTILGLGLSAIASASW